MLPIPIGSIFDYYHDAINCVATTPRFVVKPNSSTNSTKLTNKLSLSLRPSKQSITSMSEKRLFLLDGHALVYRAHFAFINRPLINSKGFNTSAITGFTRTLWDLMRNQNPTHLAVAFDPSGPTFRHEMMESYKANREEQPEDIRASFP